MNQRKLLYIAAFLTLFTFVGHSFGTLLPQEAATEELKNAYGVMESTFMTMPFGAPRSLARMAYGGNAFISLYLFVAGMLLVLSANEERYVRSIVILNSMGLLVCGVFSYIFFFPLPAICTFIGGVLGLVATKK